MGSSDLTRGLRADHPTLLFGLAPGGVYLASTITGGPVSSYLAFSPLPHEINNSETTPKHQKPEFYSSIVPARAKRYFTGRYLFCGTFPQLLGAAVSSHPVLWSPDFPLPATVVHGGRKRPLDPL